MSWVQEEKIRDNVEQAAGWLILIGAREYDEIYTGEGEIGYKKKPDLTVPGDKENHSGWQCGAYEFSTCIHGDIEYLYTLDLNKLTIKVQKPVTRNGVDTFKTIETITDFTSEPDSEPESDQDYPVLDPDELEIV
jgi:hypothetical protein